VLAVVGGEVDLVRDEAGEDVVAHLDAHEILGPGPPRDERSAVFEESLSPTQGADLTIVASFASSISVSSVSPMKHMA
jgi:hypothetical protein